MQSSLRNSVILVDAEIMNEADCRHLDRLLSQGHLYSYRSKGAIAIIDFEIKNLLAPIKFDTVCCE